MAIFDQTQMTAQEQAALAVTQAKARLNNYARQYATAFMREFDEFWRNSNCTPQDMAAAWGTEAVKLSTNSALTKTYLLQIWPGCLSDEYLTPPLPVVLNQDGTVTVG